MQYEVHVLRDVSCAVPRGCATGGTRRMGRVMGCAWDVASPMGTPMDRAMGCGVRGTRPMSNPRGSACLIGSPVGCSCPMGSPMGRVMGCVIGGTRPMGRAIGCCMGYA